MSTTKVVYWGTGRRKTAVARVRVVPGNGTVTINGRPGGMKTETFAALQARIPERIIEKAVKGMLPHNALGRQLFRKLKVYKGAEHPHAAQQPKALALDPAASAASTK